MFSFDVILHARWAYSKHSIRYAGKYVLPSWWRVVVWTLTGIDDLDGPLPITRENRWEKCRTSFCETAVKSLRLNCVFLDLTWLLLLCVGCLLLPGSGDIPTGYRPDFCPVIRIIQSDPGERVRKESNPPHITANVVFHGFEFLNEMECLLACYCRAFKRGDGSGGKFLIIDSTSLFIPSRMYRRWHTRLAFVLS